MNHKYNTQVFPDVCTFFIYDRQQDICQLYDYDSQAYADSCALIAATPTPALAECVASDEECLVRFYKTNIKNVISPFFSN